MAPRKDRTTEPEPNAAADARATDAVPTTHIYFVLDRSGSMHSIVDDVIGGFNGFLADQQREGDDALMTFVQFDTNDPAEVLAEACPIREVIALDHHTYVPRGGTPLYDAMGQAIARADLRALRRAAAGEPNEHVVFVTFTDGEENSSTHFTRETVFALVEQREALGWSFVYLGANHDSYAASRAIGFDPRSTQQYRADSIGTRVAFESLSDAAVARRRKTKATTPYNVKDFFEGDKKAEDDDRKRRRRR